MKNLFKTTLVAFIAAVMMSCGSADKANFIGDWTPDLGSIDFELSDAIPAEALGGMDKEKIKAEMAENQSEVDDVKFEFKEDGTITVGPEGDTKDFKWDVDGNNLVISGELDEGEMKGKKFNMAFEIVESSADKFTLKLTGTSLWEQVQDQYGKEIDKLMDENPMAKMFDIEKILGESWGSISFTKKGAEA